MGATGQRRTQRDGHAPKIGYPSLLFSLAPPFKAGEGQKMLRRSCCGRCREKESASEAERELYCCGAFTADTMYCHHLDRSGRHVVLNGLPSSEACRCGGVIYASFGLFGTSLACGPQRGGHDPCTPERCPFLHEGEACPFMQAIAAPSLK